MQPSQDMKTWLLALSLAPVIASAETPKASEQLSDANVQIVAKLHHANLMEMDMSGTAIVRGTKAVKPFASTMVREHKAADAKLVQLARRHGLTAIPEPADMPPDDPSKKLEKLEGAKFDVAYVDQMILDHSDGLHLIDTALSIVKDPDLRAALTEVRPMIQRHLDAALKLQKPQASAQR